jgi:hypothetical protein
MSITPSHTSIGRLFTDQYIFRVPKYQRNYAWTDEHIADFVDDLRKCHVARSSSRARHHFFGGIVSVEERIPGSARRHCDLVDGQQRIATFILLIASMVSIYRSLKADAQAIADTANEKLLEQRVKDLTWKFLKYEDEVNRQIVTIDRLEVSGADRDFFKGLINEYFQTERRESHRRLAYAYKSIKAFIANEIVAPQPSLPDKLDALKRFEEILNEDFTVIHIVTETKREAYRLFQVLNDRGTGLTEGDLLRSKTMELLEPYEYSDQQDRVEKAWNDILADPYQMTDDFLKWYYSSVRGRRPGTSSLIDDYLTAFFPQHTNDDETVNSVEEADAIVTAVCQIQTEVAIYRKLIEGIWPFDLVQPVTQWDTNRLNLLVVELKHTNCIPLLLAAVDKLTPKDFSEIVQTIERFIFRYKTISNKHISPVTAIYLEQSVAIRASSETNPYRVSVLQSRLRDLLNDNASDPVFRSNLEQLEYSPRGSNKPLKYFLMTLEHYYRWYRDGGQGQPECRDKTRIFDFANTTIEHIYPQNARVVRPNLTPLINDLGNLTFLGPDDNQDAGNGDFLVKKPIFAESSVALNREIGLLDQWDEVAVHERKQQLLNMALKIFTI